MCPLSIVNRNTLKQRPKTTMVYLDDKYARLSFNISAPAGTECHNSVVVNKCVDECYKSGKIFALTCVYLNFAQVKDLPVISGVVKRLKLHCMQLWHHVSSKFSNRVQQLHQISLSSFTGSSVSMRNKRITKCFRQ